MNMGYWSIFIPIFMRGMDWHAREAFELVIIEAQTFA
jgi:hypothetical protein